MKPNRPIIEICLAVLFLAILPGCSKVSSANTSANKEEPKKAPNALAVDAVPAGTR